MIVQYDKLEATIRTGWFVEFENRVVFIARLVGKIDEDERTIEIPEWLAIKNGLEGYEV